MEETILIGVLALLGALVVYQVFKRLTLGLWQVVANSVMGVALIYLLGKYLGFQIPLTYVTVLVCAIFGVPGAGTLVVLKYFNYI